MSDEVGRWQLQELVAVSWSDDMEARFPGADHTFCRCVRSEDGVRCYGWHCNRCGASTNSYGHHSCPDRPVTA